MGGIEKLAGAVVVKLLVDRGPVPQILGDRTCLVDIGDGNRELRAVAGNFLFSTGANEFAGRYTAGHFDLPMMGTTIELDGVAVIREGVLQDVFG